MLSLDILNDCDASPPTAEAMHAAVEAALRVGGRSGDTEISLCITDSDAMRELNNRFRYVDRPTNVLSFPADLPPELPIDHLGDIVICAAVVESEARGQNKSPEAHWAHLLVHGTLHLLGYDHIDDAEALRMEALETEALESLGWPCPYDSPEVAAKRASAQP